MTSYVIGKKYRLNSKTFTLSSIKTKKDINIGHQDFLVLQFLCKNVGLVLTKEEILDAAWKNKVVGENSLAQSIRNIRKCLDDDGKTQYYIKTIAGKGYIIPDSVVSVDMGGEFNKSNNNQALIVIGFLVMFSIPFTLIVNLLLFLMNENSYDIERYDKNEIIVFYENDIYNANQVEDFLSKISIDDNQYKRIYFYMTRKSVSMTVIKKKNEFHNYVFLWNSSMIDDNKIGEKLNEVLRT
ncbi:winged helix-turn-helix domain-containing protein [Vibrio coralliilyticus]|uniref:winged helix-turn-helix domain-containing protein n=1 Tax=Vibrio coralliilyticus TaxID=190893 RepID=UPI00155FBA10|nr:winged helix-turn-helix domain-containing protein [Vibrio coralliilyticus]NRF27955.1 winged helix-turn-helix domain-containing protein [Vibrio coralliilyticus]NRF82083.1 winged helix-turn-helix domain-containing protein [Vibrio coralliilyticus]